MTNTLNQSLYAFNQWRDFVRKAKSATEEHERIYFSHAAAFWNKEYLCESAVYWQAVRP